MSSSTGGLPRPFRSSDPRAILPRSVSLALWLPRTAGGYCSPEVAVARVQHEDEPHTVSVQIDSEEKVISLIEFVRSLSGSLISAGCAFPVPGDIASAPYFAAHEGVEAEELVLLRLRERDGTQRNIALIPQIDRFGNHIEEGYLVRWRRVEVSSWEYQLLASAGSIAEASREVRSGLITIAEELMNLDVAKPSDRYGDLVDLLRDSVDITTFVPDDTPARVVSLLELSARLRAIVDIARFDDGGALSSAVADRRLALLRQVDATARRAMEAAALTSPLVTG